MSCGLRQMTAIAVAPGGRTVGVVITDDARRDL
jgi:hypothetical protein